MTSDGRSRCRWHDNPGRCGDPVAFPGVPDVPELCARHIVALDPWIRTRAAARQATADQWIGWARRQAEETEDVLRAVGAIPPAHRVKPTAGNPMTRGTPVPYEPHDRTNPVRERGRRVPR